MQKDKDTNRGLYPKYNVQRLDDPGGKHTNCGYFVLDLNHDKFSIPALRAYAEACKEEYPYLSHDLMFLCDTLDTTLAPSQEQNP